MKTSKKILKICSRGHKFYKSSDCPVCPKCWPAYALSELRQGKPGYYKDQKQSDFPKLGAPALRALLNAKIMNLKELSKFSEEEILELHGTGPGTMPKLKIALKKKGLKFNK
jgi:hypothetical protein